MSLKTLQENNFVDSTRHPKLSQEKLKAQICSLDQSHQPTNEILQVSKYYLGWEISIPYSHFQCPGKKGASRTQGPMKLTSQWNSSNEQILTGLENEIIPSLCAHLEETCWLQYNACLCNIIANWIFMGNGIFCVVSTAVRVFSVHFLSII